MIVDFTITNFKSIKDEETLSFLAERNFNNHKSSISSFENKSINLLKTCAIYGSNASGKTNALLAFKALVSLITQSGDWKDEDEINCYEPYLLSEKTINQPTQFEIEFYIKERRYRYEIHFNQYKILFEQLDTFFTTKASNLFKRKSADDWKSVDFGEKYQGGRKQIAFFANNTYIAKAGNTPDSPPVIREIFNFFRKQVDFMLAHERISVLSWDKDNRTSEIMNIFLNKIDLGIKKFQIEKNEKTHLLKKLKDIEKFPKIMQKELIQEFFTNEISKKEFFLHESEDGKLVPFPKALESSGTKKLFEILPFIIQVLNNGSIIFIDEIEGNLHPHIAELIIKLFNDSSVNRNHAQLIFTTHDLSLMNPQLFRKDQIYLVEKKLIGGTTFTNLEEFDSTLKDNSPFSKWYNEGRLGSIPSINYKEISDSLKEVF